MKINPKKKMGRKMMTPKERATPGLGYERSKAWKARQIAIKARVAKREAAVKARRLEREKGIRF